MISPVGADQAILKCAVVDWGRDPIKGIHAALSHRRSFRTPLPPQCDAESNVKDLHVWYKNGARGYVHLTSQCLSSFYLHCDSR